MRDYGKVYGTFWSSATTAGMSDDGKLLALYLMTCSHATIAGVFRLPDGYVAEDLGWTQARVGKGFAELFDKGFANRCSTTKWVVVQKHLEWNPPENPNQRKAAAKIVVGVPNECAWKRAFMRAWGESLGIELEPDDDGCETLSEGFRNQEQKQEQKSEAGAVAGVGTADAASTKGHRLPADWVLPKAWGEWALEEFPRWTADTVRTEASKFADHWHSKSGKDATKLDWLMTWRNWCRNARSPVGLKPAAGGSAAKNEEAKRLLGFGSEETFDA